METHPYKRSAYQANHSSIESGLPKVTGPVKHIIYVCFALRISPTTYIIDNIKTGVDCSIDNRLVEVEYPDGHASDENIDDSVNTVCGVCVEIDTIYATTRC